MSLRSRLALWLISLAERLDRQGLDRAVRLRASSLDERPTPAG